LRLWSLHPKYLDAKGLVALWREGLLALNVLRGNTRGYRRHPQLDRFRGTEDPVGAVNRFLWNVHDEAVSRGYRFDAGKLDRRTDGGRIDVASGQLEYELAHLRKKLAARDPERGRRLDGLGLPDPNPLFSVVPGGIEDWERTM